MLDPNDIKTRHTSIFEEANAPVVVAKVEVKEEERKERREMRIPEAKPLNGNVKDY